VRFERSDILRGLGRRKRYAFYSSFIGRTLPVLYEHDDQKGHSSGLTPNYIRVDALPGGRYTNEILPTTITGIEGDGCIGTVATSSINIPKGEERSYFDTMPYTVQPTRSLQELP